MIRHAYMISDGTGITIESLGNSLMTQFDSIQFEKKTIPYVDNLEKAKKLVDELNVCAQSSGHKPIVFITIVNGDINACIKQANACVLDLFNPFIAPLERELGSKSSHTVGKTHGVLNIASYDHRIEAVNFALAHDDGIKTKTYDQADIILIGVSRCGKTPSCLYMALQFGILAANYPFIEDDLSHFTLPEHLRAVKHKLFGLTIDPQRLQHIRTERRPNSQYASNEQCRREIGEVEQMYLREKIPFINSTRYSIEEIATKIMASANLSRRI